MSVDSSGVLSSAHQDSCVNYDPDKGSPLSVTSAKMGRLYECRKYYPKPDALDSDRGCCFCKNLSKTIKLVDYRFTKRFQPPPWISVASLNALYEARNYIVHVGMNQLVRGQPHPQELVLDNLQMAINEIEENAGLSPTPSWRDDIEPWEELSDQNT